MDWKNRIIGYDVKPADQFNANPLNFRTHPQAQRDAVNGSLKEIGWYDVAIENVRTGNLIDGHERVWQALQNHNASVPYLKVDLSENEERLALASHDFMTTMAEHDRAILEDLLREVNTTDAAMMETLSKLAEEAGIVDLGSVGFREYDESTGNNVKTICCPHCGEEFPI